MPTSGRRVQWPFIYQTPPSITAFEKSRLPVNNELTCAPTSFFFFFFSLLLEFPFKIPNQPLQLFFPSRLVLVLLVVIFLF